MKLFIKKLSSLLGPKGWVDSKNSKYWQRDWLDSSGEIPIGVAIPKTTNEVSEILQLCQSENIKVVPQGGNTGLVGGGVLGEAGGLIISLSRMNSITGIDIYSGTISVESGVILENLHQSLENTELIFPMHLGSQGSAQIGGLIATNAGGSHAFRYGMMQDLVLGLEVVLSDGSIWNGMRSVQKDNSGYQLRKIFCGSEGTLGIITQAILKLSSRPKKKLTALLAISNASALTKISAKLKTECEDFLSAIEFFSDVGLEIALNNISGLSFPLENRAPFYILLETTSGSKDIPLEIILTDIMEWGMDQGIIIDGALAQSEAQKLAFWRLREDQPEGQRKLGPQLKHDLSVPIGHLEEFLVSANNKCISMLNNVRINAFGHLGDGNIHYNLSPPEGQQNFSGLDNEFSAELSALASKLGGSFAAEHGIGRTKTMLADDLRDSSERELMRRIKDSLDDTGMLNPGVIVSS